MGVKLKDIIEPEKIDTNENIDQTGQSNNDEEFSSEPIENTDDILSETEENEVSEEVVEINEMEKDVKENSIPWVYYVIAILGISAVLLALRLKK